MKSQTKNDGISTRAVQRNNAARPRARQTGLTVQPLPDELLVYDLERHKAHCLNQTAMRVWHLCDGDSTVAKIVERMSGELSAAGAEALVWHALDQLSSSHLLQDPLPAPYETAGMSRRTFLRKTVVVGGISVIVPVVASLVAPLPAQAISGNPLGTNCFPVGSPCAADFQCCQNNLGIRDCQQHYCQ